jgi:hypothetical protein
MWLIKLRTLQWRGHVVRMYRERTEKKLLECKRGGRRRKKGRLMLRWVDDVESDLRNMDVTRSTTRAWDRIEWASSWGKPRANLNECSTKEKEEEEVLTFVYKCTCTVHRVVGTPLDWSRVSVEEMAYTRSWYYGSFRKSNCLVVLKFVSKWGTKRCVVERFGSKKVNDVECKDEYEVHVSWVCSVGKQIMITRTSIGKVL